MILKNKNFFHYIYTFTFAEQNYIGTLKKPMLGNEHRLILLSIKKSGVKHTAKQKSNNMTFKVPLCGTDLNAVKQIGFLLMIINYSIFSDVCQQL